MHAHVSSHSAHALTCGRALLSQGLWHCHPAGRMSASLSWVCPLSLIRVLPSRHVLPPRAGRPSLTDCSFWEQSPLSHWVLLQGPSPHQPPQTLLSGLSSCTGGQFLPSPVSTLFLSIGPWGRQWLLRVLVPESTSEMSIQTTHSSQVRSAKGWQLWSLQTSA